MHACAAHGSSAALGHGLWREARAEVRDACSYVAPIVCPVQGSAEPVSSRMSHHGQTTPGAGNCPAATGFVHATRQVGRNVEELEDVRLIVHRGELYLQFVGSMRTFDKDGKRELHLEGRQWLGRLERTPQVRMLGGLCRSKLRAE